jgi:alkylhydroperoxidase family enzyme
MEAKPTDVWEPPIDTSRMPRIPFLSYDDAEAEERELWDEMAGQAEKGELLVDPQHALFRTLIHHPELMRLHVPFDLYTKDSTKLPLRHRELAIMRSAWLCGVDDQWVNHTKIGLECGLTAEEIERIARGPDAPGWSTEDADVLRAVDELHAWCRVSDATWSALARNYDKQQLIEFLFLIGKYHTLSYVQNSIGIRPVTGTSPDIPGNRFLFTGP